MRERQNRSRSTPAKWIAAIIFVALPCFAGYVTFAQHVLTPTRKKTVYLTQAQHNVVTMPEETVSMSVDEDSATSSILYDEAQTPESLPEESFPETPSDTMEEDFSPPPLKSSPPPESPSPPESPPPPPLASPPPLCPPLCPPPAASPPPPRADAPPNYEISPEVVHAVSQLQVELLQSELEESGKVKVKVVVSPTRKAAKGQGQDLSQRVFKWLVASGDSLLVPNVTVAKSKKDKLILDVEFTPAGAGLHSLGVRQEYASKDRALMDPIGDCRPRWKEECDALPEERRPADYVGLELLGSPLALNITQAPLRPLPLCTGTESPGVWRRSSVEPSRVFQPRNEGNGQRECTNCEQTAAKMRLGQPLHQGDVTCQQLYGGLRITRKELTEYDGQQCRYCQYTKEEGRKCLRRMRVTFGGDSVTMDVCNHMRCALAEAEGVDCRVSYDHRTCSEANPERASKERECDGQQNPLHESYHPVIQCASWDQFAGGQYASRALDIVLSQAAGTDEELAARMARYREVLVNAPKGDALEGDEAVEEEDIQDVLVLSAGAHDSAYHNLYHEKTLFPRALDRVFKAAFAAGYDRVVWQTASAIHPQVPFFANCTSGPEDGLMRPHCNIDQHTFMTSPRIEYVNHLVLDHVRQHWSHPANRVEILDAFAVSDAREDATGHRDMVHYCPAVYKGISHVLMHMLCGCDHDH